MNILVVNESYTRGGLETHIYTQYETMKEKHKFTFAMGYLDSKLDFDNCKIYKNFHFAQNVTIQEFYEDVNRLIEIIENEKIDVIHAHPFYSVFQAVFAAKLTNTPIVYTLHGIASYNFPSRSNDTILYYTMLESEIDKIFGVSNICVSAVNNTTFSNKAELLPNSVNVEKFSKKHVVNNKKWALISRISIDKIKEIKSLLSMLVNLDIEQICIYGDGDSKEELQQFIELKGLTEKVKLLGHCDNLFEELDDKYNGIIGIGRVAIESICMGYPTLLIGYGKVAGIIDNKIYSNIKNNNFINKMLPHINAQTLNVQLQNVYNGNINYEEISNMLREEFDSKKIYEKYEKELENLQVYSAIDINRIYKEICEIENSNNSFYSSREVYNILKKYIETQCISSFIKGCFINYNNYYALKEENNQFQYDIQKSIDEINGEFEELNSNVETVFSENSEKLQDLNKRLQDLNKRLQETQDRINVKFLAYNTVERVKKRKKSQE